jgi:hypothetical protein
MNRLTVAAMLILLLLVACSRPAANPAPSPPSQDGESGHSGIH